MRPVIDSLRDVPHRATESLANDESLRPHFDGPPPSALLNPPSETNITKPYLMVSPDLKEAAVEIGNISFICGRITAVLLHNSLLTGLSGLEILPRVVRNGRAVRILRLSILSHALIRAQSLTPQDLVRAVPFDGCTSIIYEKSIYTLPH